MSSQRVLTRAGALAVVVALTLWALSAWTSRHAPSTVDRYQTAPVTRGDVVATVMATGTLNPLSVVSVGTQVSGTIKRLYVDFNDEVTAGQLLAELDPAVYRAAANQTRANLNSARASLGLARQIETRHENLLERGLIAQQAFEEAVQRRIAAEAQIAVLEAQLSGELTSLGYTKIRAPVSGVVLSREVAVGQTVAASFQTPELFKIAEDLSSMQVECRVPEADVGALRVGLRASFTVDAFPDKTFTGTLRQLRLDPKIEEDVVTYSVIVDVDNAGGELMPGMTALVNIVVEERRDVLRVPSVAIDFRPRDPSVKPDRTAPAATLVYVAGDDGLRPVRVDKGLSDGEHTEISWDALQPGTRVAIAESTAAAQR